MNLRVRRAMASMGRISLVTFAVFVAACLGCGSEPHPNVVLIERLYEELTLNGEASLFGDITIRCEKVNRPHPSTLQLKSVNSEYGVAFVETRKSWRAREATIELTDHNGLRITFNHAVFTNKTGRILSRYEIASFVLEPTPDEH